LFSSFVFRFSSFVFCLLSGAFYNRPVIRAVAAISLVYDISIGITLFLFRELFQIWFGVPAPQPPIHVDLNALFVTSVGVGYLLPYRDPIRYRAYMWIFGVALKFGGAAAFLADYLTRGSPASFLLFAASDGLIAVLTLVALAKTGLKPGPSSNFSQLRNL
jgi:hypothetical protein